METIGIIGTGAIGLPITKNLIHKGYKINFFARKQDVIKELLHIGGVYLNNIEQMGESCNIVFLFVKDYDDCHSCIKKLLVKMKEGTIIVGSTIAPNEIRELYNLCLTKSINLVSAPVTGGVQGATNGTLTTIISGKQCIVNDLYKIISAYSKEIINLGEDISLSFIMKALVQYLVSVNTVALVEAYLLAIKNGLNKELTYKVICNSSGNSKIFESRYPTIMDNDFHKRGTIEILAKDLNIVMDISKYSGVPLLMGALVNNLFNVANCTLDNHEDFSAILKLYEKMIK